jgi:exonuclease III
MFEEYVKMAVWNKAAENGKGHGGIMVLVKKKKGRLIQLEREDSNKQFIWFKISENGNIIRIAACYFAPQVSKTYKSRGLDHKDPFAALKNDIAAYSQLSEVLIVGDFNARTTCEQASILRCKEDCNPIWLTEERNHQWTRVSEDNKSSNFFGEQLLTLCGAFDLVICNGVARWANSGNFTCNTYNGASVVDYAICSHGLCEKMEEVLIGEQLWELKSDHKPIYLSLTWAEQQQHGTKNQHIRQPPSKGRILLTQKNCNTFKIALKRLFNKEKIPSQGLHSHELTNLIQSALTECKRAKNRKSETNCFPVNVWFDEECKTTRKTLKESSHKEISIKAYKQIVRKKKVDFMISRREELIFLGKNNPKLFWKELQTRKKQTENNITAYQWFEYAKQLYEQDPKVDPPPPLGQHYY